jgi:ribosomal protein L40E
MRAATRRGDRATPASEDHLPLTISQVLDLLMALVLIMFVPIGLWRGALREWLTLAGITLGLLLAGSWAAPWGTDLAAATGRDQNLTSFTVAIAFFLGSTLIVGYGGGVTLPYRPDLTGTNRFLGALLGLGNGTLILSGVLQIMQRNLFDGRPESPLKTAGLAAFLIDSVGWVYLGLFAIFIGCIVAGLARRWTEGTPLLEEYAPSYAASGRNDWDQQESWSPAVPPVKPTPSPTRQPVATEGQQATTVLQVVPNTPAGRPQSPNSAAPTPPQADPAAPTLQVTDITRRQTALATLPANVTPIGNHNGRPAAERASNDEQPSPRKPTATRAGDAPTLVPRPMSRAEAPTLAPRPNNAGDASTLVPRPVKSAVPAPAAPAEAAETAAQVCGSCGAAAPPNARFCLTCGHIIGTTEKRQVARRP